MGISPPRHDMLCFGELASLRKKRRFCVLVKATVRVDGRMHMSPGDQSLPGLSSTEVDVVLDLYPKAFTRLWSSPIPGTAFSLPVAFVCPGNARLLVSEANLSLWRFHGWWTRCRGWLQRGLCWPLSSGLWIALCVKPMTHSVKN